jgi:hypothetical protein
MSQKLIQARHAQGLAAYRAGHSIKHMIEVAGEINAMHDHPGITAEQHEEIENSLPSFAAGFADGFLEDIRLIAGQRRGQTA